MDTDDYKRGLQRWRDKTAMNLAELSAWTEAEGLAWLWNEFAGIIGQERAKPLQAHHAVRQGLRTTPADFEKMPFEKTFYHAQVTMLDAEARKYIKAAAVFERTPSPYTDTRLEILHDGLHTILAHGIILFEQASHCLLELPGTYGGWRRTQEHPFEIYRGAEQAVYGRFSGMTFKDRAPFIGVAVLRTAIENRLRSAFGVYSYTDTRNASLVPIALSELFDAIRPHLSNIEFAVDFHDVARIYRWSNPYLHAGSRDFIWVAGYALEYLHPLFAGGALSVDGGIRMPRQTWRQIRQSFEEPTRPNLF